MIEDLYGRRALLFRDVLFLSLVKISMSHCENDKSSEAYRLACTMSKSGWKGAGGRPIISPLPHKAREYVAGVIPVLFPEYAVPERGV
jgi:hypothetical protein